MKKGVVLLTEESLPKTSPPNLWITAGVYPCENGDRNGDKEWEMTTKDEILGQYRDERYDSPLPWSFAMFNCRINNIRDGALVL